MTRRNRPWTIEEILANLEPITESGCLIWGGRSDDLGYATIRYHGRNRRIHRIIYEHFRGPIPNELELDHLCRVRACGNEYHLEPVTQKVNTLRGISFSAQNARKTNCAHGHDLSGTNVWYRSRNKGNRITTERHCKLCRIEGYRRYRKKKTALAAYKQGTR